MIQISLEYLVLIGLVLGFLVGFFAALSGTGGGSLNVPIFDALLLMDIQVAIGTSLFVIFVNSISSNIAYLKQKRVDFKSGLIMASVSIPFAILGSMSTGWIAEGITGSGKTIMRVVFYIFIMFIGFYMILKKNNVNNHELVHSKNKGMVQCSIIDADGICFEYRYSLKTSIPLTCMGGFLSGFLGIGGGMVQVPVLYLVCGIPLHVCVATSSFIILFNSGFSTVFKFLLGDVDLLVGVIFAAGSVVGAQLGARFAKGQKHDTLKKILSGVLITLAVYKLVMVSL